MYEKFVCERESKVNCNGAPDPNPIFYAAKQIYQFRGYFQALHLKPIIWFN